MKSCSRSLFTDGDGEREGERGLELQESLLTIKKEPDGERDRKETQKEGKKLKFVAAGAASPDVCGCRSRPGASMWMEKGGEAERRQVGRSVAASHWCAPLTWE